MHVCMSLRIYPHVGTHVHMLVGAHDSYMHVGVRALMHAGPHSYMHVKHTCLHACRRTCLYACRRTLHVGAHVYMHVSAHVYVHVGAHICVHFGHMSIHMSAHMSTCVSARMFTCMSHVGIHDLISLPVGTHGCMHVSAHVFVHVYARMPLHSSPNNAHPTPGRWPVGPDTRTRAGPWAIQFPARPGPMTLGRGFRPLGGCWVRLLGFLWVWKSTHSSLSRACPACSMCSWRQPMPARFCLRELAQGSTHQFRVDLGMGSKLSRHWAPITPRVRPIKPPPGGEPECGLREVIKQRGQLV